MGLNGLMGLLVPCKNKVFTAWGSDVIFPKFPRLLNLMIRRADLLTTDAQHVVDKLISLGAKSDQVKIINFGIETDFFVKKPKDEQYREKLFKGTAEDPIIISLRNHETVYDIETLIESIPIVLKEIPNAKFAIGGSGTLTSKYTELVKSLSVEESVNFFGSYIHDELPNLFSQVHAYVSTSLSDAGLSASTAEAMSCEVPVIISNSGENSLWVTDDENGDLFPIKDSQELAIRIMNNIKHRELSIKKGQKGREIIVRDNDVINEMKKMNELYSTFS
jgi:glycosyltransferase involved in cell wall biosynthesis